MSDAKAFVDGKIGSKKVIVFSKTYCPFCTKAKAVLKEYNLLSQDYEVIEIEDNAMCDEIQDYLLQLTGARSVPRVFINGNFLGGGDETVAAHNSGKLKDLLN